MRNKDWKSTHNQSKSRSCSRPVAVEDQELFGNRDESDCQKRNSAIKQEETSLPLNPLFPRSHQTERKPLRSTSLAKSYPKEEYFTIVASLSPSLGPKPSRNSAPPPGPEITGHDAIVSNPPAMQLLIAPPRLSGFSSKPPIAAHADEEGAEKRASEQGSVSEILNEEREREGSWWWKVV